MPRRAVKITTLREAGREYMRHLSPVLLLVEVAALAVVRAVVGGWSWVDLVVAGALVAAQPFTEWLIHVYVLHSKPGTPLVDRLAGLSHRLHHEDPYDLRWQFIHRNGVIGGMVLAGAVAAVWTTGPVVTGLLTAAVLKATYEWIHFLIHTDYPPRTKAYRALHRHHRLHHYRNESYWLGVTRRFGDKALGTMPEKTAVEVSPTARTALAGLKREPAKA